MVRVPLFGAAELSLLPLSPFAGSAACPFVAAASDEPRKTTRQWAEEKGYDPPAEPPPPPKKKKKKSKKKKKKKDKKPPKKKAALSRFASWLWAENDEAHEDAAEDEHDVHLRHGQARFNPNALVVRWQLLPCATGFHGREDFTLPVSPRPGA